MRFLKFLNFKNKILSQKNSLTLIFLILFISMIFLVRLFLTEKKIPINKKSFFFLISRNDSFGIKLRTKYSFIWMFICVSMIMDYVWSPKSSSYPVIPFVNF